MEASLPPRFPTPNAAAQLYAGIFPNTQRRSPPYSTFFKVLNEASNLGSISFHVSSVEW